MLNHSLGVFEANIGEGRGSDKGKLATGWVCIHKLDLSIVHFFLLFY